MRINPETIYIHKDSRDTIIGKHVLQAFPNAKVETIKFNTWAENGNTHSLAPEDFFREKAKKLAVLHRQAQWQPDPNGRSTDFLPNQMMTRSCGFFCSYCYVNRHFPNGYPKLYDDALNVVQMVGSVMSDLPRWRRKFLSVCGKPFEKERDPKHSPYVTFDLGCDSDCVLDNQMTRHDGYSGHIVEVMNGIAAIDGAMSSFATKGDDFEAFISGCKQPGRNRIRLSLMPEHHRRILELNTATIESRLTSVNRLVAAGFEVHINLSPIVVTPKFETEYLDLLHLIADSLTQEAKAQLAYEIIFLTHSASLFESTQINNPKAHAMMVEGPLPLEPKLNKPNVLSYGKSDKTVLKKWLMENIEAVTPYARVRYCF